MVDAPKGYLRMLIEPLDYYGGLLELRRNIHELKVCPFGQKVNGGPRVYHYLIDRGPFDYSLEIERSVMITVFQEHVFM